MICFVPSSFSQSTDFFSFLSVRSLQEKTENGGEALSASPKGTDEMIDEHTCGDEREEETQGKI